MIFSPKQRDYQRNRYRRQPGDGTQYPAWSGLEALIRAHQSPYDDDSRRDWIARKLRRWAGEQEQCDTEKPSESSTRPLLPPE